MNVLSKPISLEQKYDDLDVLVQVKAVTAGYGKNPIVRDISLNASLKQIVAIIGPNGAGKSTFLKAISGVIQPMSGEVKIAGDNVAGMPPETIVRHGVSFVPQMQDVFPSLTTSENLDMGGYLERRNRAERREEIVGMFPILKEKLNQKAATLSGGERKVLALAKAMMSRPRVLLLDEPSAALAPAMVQTVWDYIRQLREGGVTIIIVEQKARAVLELADKGYIFVNGQKALEDEAQNLLSREDLGKIFLS